MCTSVREIISESDRQDVPNAVFGHDDDDQKSAQLLPF